MASFLNSCLITEYQGIWFDGHWDKDRPQAVKPTALFTASASLSGGQ
jgi:hypothetical protein